MPMIRAPRLLLALLLLVAAVPAAAQDLASLSWLTGSWRGSGTAFGNPSEATLEVRPALGGRFLELSYRAGQFEGRAFYRPVGEGRWQATWFDNRGISFPIEARIEGQTLITDWGTSATERGRTIYRLGADGTLEVSDTAIRPDGTSRDFARHVLTRAP